ncbi:hypothetical protein JTE90_022178 [Oedothorax gibbosus]|uniref:G-protein coupled receptors family 1 profile domain-containing protein n=1 Tax=Oedothorax gibbosus TaxID=931172 RepID=A0AAV6VQM5_9ARAC|nr:hypothetical protein JTE90_022178 [Oedothorax gibbosus]
MDQVSDKDNNCTQIDNFICNHPNCSNLNDDGFNCSNVSWLSTMAPILQAIHPNPSLEEFQLNSRFWIQRILVPLIMIIGFVGNTVTIFIMTQRRMRSSTNWYLAALAIVDMSYLVFSFILSFTAYPHIHESQFYFYWKLWPYFVTITDASSNSSVWITVTFTIERYIAVCHPMKGKVICTESRAIKMIVIVFLICFFITLPTFFEYNIIETENPLTNVTEVHLDTSDLGNNPVYVTTYYWIITVTFVFIPLLLLTVFNAFLIKSVHSSKSRRKTMTRRRDTGDQSTQESKITIMLIAVVILFLICQLPTAITLLYKAFHTVEPRSNEDLLLRGLGNIFNFLVAVNAAGNFVLYSLLSQKYRKTFVLIFCPCLTGKITRLHSVYQNTVYSTMDNESPAASRRYSVHAQGGSKMRDCSISMNQSSFPNQKRSTSVPKSQQQLSFSKKVAVFADNNDTYPVQEDPSSRRLLRGFRCPWKRTKIATGTDQEEATGQFIPLKSPDKTGAFSPGNAASGTVSE